MRFLLDANLPYSAKDIFGKDDEALHVCDLGLTDSDDSVIFARARRERAILITRDLEFGNILLFPPSSHYGVVVLRVPSHYHAKEIIRVLSEFLSKVDKKTLRRSVVIVEEGRFRIRK